MCLRVNPDMVFLIPWERHPLSPLFLASGTLMISKTLRIPKL